MERKRVLSGMRPTGRLHLGHYHGVLENWLKFQLNFDCYFFAADWHSLTTEYANTKVIKESMEDMVLDWLAVGINPEKSVIFVQSDIHEHAELHLLLSMITPISWLERNPTYKDMQQELKTKDLATYGFLGYPVLQAADIIIYKSHMVPIGVDQLPHLELTREITRRFNYLYKEIFTVPDPILTETPKLLGIDGRKMSKSFGNAIYLSDTPEEVNKKVAQMITDPQRIRRKDPGNPEVCTVCSYHKIYNTIDNIRDIEEGCRTAEIGCVECKKGLAIKMNEFLAPINTKRAEIQKKKGYVKQVLEAGMGKAKEVASKTMDEVKKVVGLNSRF